MGDHINGIDPDPDLRLECRHLRHDVVLVEIAGELDILTAPQLRAYLAEQAAACPAHLVLDMSGVTFMSSHGLQLLVGAARNSDGIHGTLHLVGVTGNRFIERLLELTGLAASFSIHPDVSELLRRLEQE